MNRQRLAIVASHVIQYQDPFFRLLAQDADIDLTVIYCSREGSGTFRDTEMQTTLSWNIELLHGYRHRFLRNFGFGSGYTRLINPGIVSTIAQGHFDAVIFMLGWGAISALMGIVTCMATGTPFALYGDSSFPPEANTAKARLRERFLRMLFHRADAFMTSGVLNADYYRHYGADPSRFFLLPWAVDNERFAAASRLTQTERIALREHYGIAPDRTVFLFAAKLLPRKDPMTLMRAYEQMAFREKAAIIFMGDGELRAGLESYVRQHRLEGVHFTKFVNQKDIPKHYAMADVFVLPSVYEPRGAVINEAMACGLPVVVTDRCGSIGDIVLEGENALIYPAGDERALAGHLDTLVSNGDLRASMSRRSLEIIRKWDFHRGVDGVRSMLQERGRRR